MIKSASVDGEIVEALLKAKNSYRAVTVSQQAIEVLKQQKAKTNDQYVFPSPNSGPISPDSVNNMLTRVLERAGIPKVRFHDLRHTFATIALQNGVDIKTVSGIKITKARKAISGACGLSFLVPPLRTVRAGNGHKGNRGGC